MTDKNCPSAPRFYRGQQAEFQGTIHFSWLHDISTEITGNVSGNQFVTSKFQLAPGIYWIVMTGSMWGYHDGEVMHAHISSPEYFSWSSGTRDMDGPYDSEFVRYVKNFPMYPDCVRMFLE